MKFRFRHATVIGSPVRGDAKKVACLLGRIETLFDSPSSNVPAAYRVLLASDSPAKSVTIQ